MLDLRTPLLRLARTRGLAFGAAATLVLGVKANTAPLSVAESIDRYQDARRVLLRRDDQADSVVIDITNTMPHPMTLSYGPKGQQKELGTVAAQSEQLVTVRDLHGDSVTVWATNLFPAHEFSQTFPIHTSTRLTWQL